jgi:pimeloyl-ACP methyl ester carboxylesterase
VDLGTIDIWAPVPGTYSQTDRGRILACTHVASLDAVTVAANPSFNQGGTTDLPRNGIEEFAIQYVSEGSPGQIRLVTALLYLPQGNAPGLPLVAVNHGTTGMAPKCGPTHLPAAVDYMAVPLAGRGYAVVATDYQGMGVDDGLSPYLVGEAEAILDGVRALRQFHDPAFDASQLSGQLFFAGHSQGGQATLFAHQLYDASVGGTLLGSVSWAPALGDLRGFTATLDPQAPTTQLGVFMAMALYGNMLYHQDVAATDWLLSDPATRLPTLLHDQCLTDLFASVPLAWPTLGDLYTSSFFQGAQGCDFDAGTCTTFAPWGTDLPENVPGNFSSSAPALILQGEADTLVTPDTTACIAAHLQAHHTPVQACGYALTDHLSIVGNSLGDALAWMSARLDGGTPDVCPAPLAETCP